MTCLVAATGRSRLAGSTRIGATCGTDELSDLGSRNGFVSGPRLNVGYSRCSAHALGERGQRVLTVAIDQGPSAPL